MGGRVAGHFLGAETREARRPTMARFQARDRSLFIAALHQPWFERLCRILDAPELVTDPRFADHAARQRHADALTSALEELVATRSAAELEQQLVEAGLPASIVRTLPEILAHPHVQQRGILEPVPAADGGEPLTLVGLPFRFGEGDAGFQGGVPALGQHTHEALAELGYSAAEIERLRAAGAL
jgi:crotonobetainyl-CoA:carnitine CoA-transferase CaiB-like acyl-CoA transferase